MLICLLALNAWGLQWIHTMDVFWCEKIKEMPFGPLAKFWKSGSQLCRFDHFYSIFCLTFMVLHLVKWFCQVIKLVSVDARSCVVLHCMALLVVSYPSMKWGSSVCSFPLSAQHIQIVLNTCGHNGLTLPL